MNDLLLGMLVLGHFAAGSQVRHHLVHGVTIGNGLTLDPGTNLDPRIRIVHVTPPIGCTLQKLAGKGKPVSADLREPVGCSCVNPPKRRSAGGSIAVPWAASGTSGRNVERRA